MSRGIKLLGLLSLLLYTITVPASTPKISFQDSTITQQTLQYDKEATTHTPLAEDQIRDYQQDKDFNYVEALPEDNWWTRFKQWLSDIWSSFIRWIFGTAPATGTLATFVRLLPYIAGFILLALLVWVFMKMDSGPLLFEKRETAIVGMAADEELIQRDDIQALIDEALAQGNYRLAIRFYYLLILQKLSIAELINWQVQKTNHDYLFEIKDNHLRQQFRTITSLYDYIWYGNFEVDEDAFAKAESPFKTLKEQL